MNKTANEHVTAADWAAGRGAKWRAQLPRLEAMLAAVDVPLIEALQLDGACRIADLACGGGGTTLAVQRHCPAGSTLHGYDISPELVAFAQERAGASGPRFTVTDLATAAPPRPPYDRLLSRFGTMFFDDPAAAFARLRGWLAPGGRYVFAVWGPPADNPWAGYVREAVSAAIDLPDADPDAPGPFRYGDAGKLLDLLRDAGFGSPEVRDWRGELPMGGGLAPEAAAQFALSAFSVAEPLKEAGDAARERAHRALTARFAQHASDGVVRIAGRVHIAVGTGAP